MRAHPADRAPGDLRRPTALVRDGRPGRGPVRAAGGGGSGLGLGWAHAAHRAGAARGPGGAGDAGGADRRPRAGSQRAHAALDPGDRDPGLLRGLLPAGHPVPGPLRPGPAGRRGGLRRGRPGAGAPDARAPAAGGLLEPELRDAPRGTGGHSVAAAAHRDLPRPAVPVLCAGGHGPGAAGPGPARRAAAPAAGRGRAGGGRVADLPGADPPVRGLRAADDPQPAAG